MQRARSVDARRRQDRGPKKYDRRSWRNGTRVQQLRREPLCRECRKQSLLVEATEVDHIDGDNANDDEANLQSLCKRCHSRKTAAEQGAFGRAAGEGDGEEG